MVGRSRRPIPLLAGFLILAAIFAGSIAGTAEVSGPAVLVLNSYHPGLLFSDEEYAGLQSVLPEDAEMFVEYMDAKRMGGNQAFLDLFFSQIEMKYGQRRPDVIVTMDDDAFEFMRTRGSHLLPDVPVVFCGVNRFEEDMVAGRPHITGVVETLDIKGSILVGLRLHPGARRVLVVTDNTTTGRVNRAIIEKLKQTGEIPAELVFLDSGPGLSLDELSAKLKEAPRDSIVYYADFFQDRSGEILDPRRTMHGISRNSRAPIFVHGGMYVGHGAVGGMVNSGYAQGQVAGRMVARILKGESAEQIPIQKDGANRYVFDYAELNRWSIPLTAVPADSVVINRERSFYERHSGAIWGVAAFLVFQSLVIAYLLTNISRCRKVQYALMESEERLRTIFEAANRVAFVMTESEKPDALITEFSLGAERMFGYTRDEMVGRPVSMLYPPETEADPSGRRPILCEDDVGVGVESSLARKSGLHFSALTSAYPVHDEKSQQTGALFITFDVTELKQAQEAVRESEARLRAIINSARDNIFIKDASLHYVLVNPAMCDMLGLEPSQILGKGDLELFGPQSGEDILNMDSRVLQGEVVEQEISKPVLGVLQSFHTIKVPIRGEDDSIVGLCGIARDVTDRKRFEQALRESEEKYRLVVENANDAIFIAQDGVIKFPNPMTTSILGYSAKELSTIPFAQHLHPEDRSLVLSRHQGRIGGEDVPQNYTFRIVDRHQQLLWMHINAVRIQWEGRSATLCFLRDITSQKNLEAQLLRAQKMEAIGTLAGGIAHDFNNLLQAILGNADMLLLTRPEGDTAHHGLQQIKRAARRGSDLTGQLLTFSRKIEAKTETVDLNHVLERLHEMLERTIPKMIAIDLQLQASLWNIDADPSQIEQVLMNLALNARDAMPNGGRLTIETRNVLLGEEYCSLHPEVRPGEYILLLVADTGHGMDKDTLQRVFDPFFTTKETGKGTGLGLAMVYGIVKNHSGYITCHSKLGEGTSFEIYLPASDAEKTPEVVIEKTVPVGGHETILLVDDEEAIREVGSDILSQYGYRVLTASDGESALEIYSSRKDEIDLIILDMSMPGMGGRQCLIKLIEMDPDVRVVIASGYSSHGPVKDAVSLGAKTVINKPYNISDILGIIRKALE